MNGNKLEEKKTKLPVIFDPSHSTGKAEYVIPVAKAAILLGADGLIVETSISSETALCDGKQALDKNKFESLLRELERLYKKNG